MPKEKQARVFTFDLYQITRQQWLDFITGKLTPEADDQLLARVTGITFDDIRAMPQPEYRRMVKALIEKARAPLDDPNSEGASSSD